MLDSLNENGIVDWVDCLFKIQLRRRKGRMDIIERKVVIMDILVLLVWLDLFLFFLKLYLYFSLQHYLDLERSI